MSVLGRLIALAKSQPCVDDVHTPTVPGRKKPKLATALEKFGAGYDATVGQEQQYRSKLEFLDTKRSKMPLRHDGNFLSSLRPDQVPRFLGCLTSPDLCRDKTVKISDLVAIQNRVDTGKVVSLAMNAAAAGGKPIVVRNNGVNYIVDGHHRVVGAWLRGDETIEVKFKNLEPVSNMMKSGQGDWSVRVSIEKTNEELRMVYGWASVIEDARGNPVVDRQSDVILLKDLMNAAHGFMSESREAGKMHTQITGVGKVVESLIVTPDIRKALGMPEGPTGWFIGMKVEDDDAWAKVKDGTFKAFSIGGSASRMKV